MDSTRIAVAGAGYAGVAAVQALEKYLGTEEAEVIWIDENDYHLVQHEVHRVIYDPTVEDTLVIPIDEIKNERTEFIKDRITDFDFSDKKVITVDEEIEYDYLIVAVGQKTNFYGIEGVEEFSHTLKSLEDAHEIRRSVEELAAKGGGDVVVGGAGLSGIQVSGEIADFLDEEVGAGRYQIKIIEALEEIMPREDEGASLRRAIRRALRSKGIITVTGDPIVEATSDAVVLESGEELGYDVFVWTGGVTSHGLEGNEVRKGSRGAIEVEATLESTDFEGVFVVGDAASVEDVEGREAPATAWAARDEGKTAARNVVRSIRDEELEDFELDPAGTLVSVGRKAVGKVEGRVVTGRTAKVLKRGAAVRHIANVGGSSRGAKSVFKDL